MLRLEFKPERSVTDDVHKRLYIHRVVLQHITPSFLLRFDEFLPRTTLFHPGSHTPDVQRRATNFVRRSSFVAREIHVLGQFVSAAGFISSQHYIWPALG